jgi:hypothetical protein
VAVSEINFNTKNHSLEMTHKIFVNDLEKQIEKTARQQGKPVELHLNSVKENPAAARYFQAYIEKHFVIQVNGKSLKMNYIGSEYETDAIWIYTEIKEVKNIKTLEIQNTILLDFYEDQTNFVHIKAGNVRQSLKFQPGESTGNLKF